MKELDRTKPVQLNDGRSVRNVCWDYKLSTGEIGISGIIRTINGDYDYHLEWFVDGRVYGNPFSINDLINVPEKGEFWLNIYSKSYGGYCISHNYTDKESAHKNAQSSRLACIKVTFTEGEGLE